MSARSLRGSSETRLLSTGVDKLSTMVDMTLSDEHITTLENADMMVREAKALYDHARTVRDREMRRVAAEGGTYREIGEVAGVAYQRVAKIVTGREPVMREANDELEHECPRCFAKPGEACEGRNKDAFHHHIERSHAAIEAWRERTGI